MLVTVVGEGSFERFAKACQDAARRDLERELDRGLNEAGEDVGQAVITASEIYMPSGYEALFAARALYKVERRTFGGRGVTVIFYARGRTGRRDVERLEAGELRHPVYGRTRRLKSGLPYKNPWSVTTIRRGFFSEPVKHAGPGAVRRRLDAALGRVLDKIGRA